MNPVFTLNYPELMVAESLQKHFTSASGYSVLIPLSAQQRGYDLAVMRRTAQGSNVATFQVKSSRTYVGTPGFAPRTRMRNFAHYMWLKRFKVPPEADFFYLDWSVRIQSNKSEKHIRPLAFAPAAIHSRRDDSLYVQRSPKKSEQTQQSLRLRLRHCRRGVLDARTCAIPAS